MKFYNREKELATLAKIKEQSLRSAQMTFVVGRRRIGKTSLLVKASENSTFLYFFIAKKNEALLCLEFADEIRQKLNIELFGTFRTFRDIFGYLMELSRTTPFTLIIDEFQEFNSINASIYSEMQNIWDSKKAESRINLILCGSVYSMMKKIFEHSKEPLFGRATHRIYLKEFGISTIRTILRDYYPAYRNEDLLALYMFSGGVAKYLELLTEAGAFTFEDILEEILAENSLFLDEGKNVLIDEFGKEYGNYFSILSLIASSKTSRVEIESIMGMQVGGFLDRLETDFGLIKKIRPVFAKPGGRSVKYAINDNFLNFWFRFIYKFRSAVEIGNLNYLKDIVKRDYKTYSGSILEKYFKEKMIDEGNYSEIGTYWEKANLNEIDIVALNEMNKTAVIAEVKRNPSKISLMELEAKAGNLMVHLKGYTCEFRGLSIDDM